MLLNLLMSTLIGNNPNELNDKSLIGRPDSLYLPVYCVPL